MISCPAYCIAQICHQDMPFTSNWRNGWWGINSDMVISIICSCLGERSFFVARWTPFTGTFADVPRNEYKFVSPIMTYTLHKHCAVRLCLTLFGLPSMYTLCVWHLMTHYSSDGNKPWASCQIRKIAGAHAPGMPGTFSPPPRVSNPDMHHGTCVTHVPWCMPGSLTRVSFEYGVEGKRSRYSRRMRNPQFCVSGKRPIAWTNADCQIDDEKHRTT